MLVTGQSEENRLRILGEALGQVLVKVSGDPTVVRDERFPAIAADAASCLTGFTYRDRMEGIPVHDEQGTRERPYELTLRFDPARIDAALRSMDRVPWPLPRPRVVVFLAVENGATAYALSRDGAHGRDLREALQDVAARYGLPVALPDDAAARAPEPSEAAFSPDLAALDAAARRLGGDAALAGSLRWNAEALGWSVEWALRTDRTDHAWAIEGVSFDQAFAAGIERAAQILAVAANSADRRK